MTEESELPLGFVICDLDAETAAATRLEKFKNISTRVVAALENLGRISVLISKSFKPLRREQR